jgi:hypothetical protein
VKKNTSGVSRPLYHKILNTMIVKIQISQFNSEWKTMMLIYNEDRSLRCEGEATEDILTIMQGEAKRFFYAKWTKSYGNVKFLIEDVAPYQTW